MVLGLNQQRITRYKDILRVLVKQSNKDLLALGQLQQDIFNDEIPDTTISGDPEALANDLQALGSTFIKLGQSLSMRPDLLPPEYQQALSRLQDNVDAFSTLEAKQIIEQELNVKINTLFSEFGNTPLAAASLGQVYKARLRDDRAVVVKVQRPGIRQQILTDLDDLATIANLLEQYTDWANHIGLRDLYSNFKQTLLKELDYQQEAYNLNHMHRLLYDVEQLQVPQAIADLTTSKVLVMDYIDGTPVSAISGTGRTEIDTTQLATTLFKAYLDQVLVHGFVHTDPHPGNVLLTQNKLALLDLGMVAHVAPAIRLQLIKLLLALSDGRGQEVTDICLQLGTPLGDVNLDQIQQQITQHIHDFQHAADAGQQLGNMVLGLTRIAMQHAVQPAAELSLLGKTLLYLDEISNLLDPGFNPKPVIQQHATAILKQQLKTSLHPNQLMRNMLEVQSFTEALPKQANRILEQLANNELKLQVESFNESKLLQTLEKIANRIAAGLVLAGLIIGAALLMPIKTTATI